MAARRFANGHDKKTHIKQSVTILKPLYGDEPELFENLVSFCRQDYAGSVQIIFGVQRPDDSAIAIVRQLTSVMPDRDIVLVIDERQHGANRKVSNLINMAARARHEIIVLADSDMRVGPDYLDIVVSTLDRPGVGLVTCLYRGQAVAGFWSQVAVQAIDTHFLPNVLVGLSLGLAHPCFGSTIALRRQTLDAIGGFAAV
ncbi:MAG: glycosyltransferase, partial [Nitrospiraceae bacterium]|nr:glycosyltransferase [Nitrospiraceae bacterium]